MTGEVYKVGVRVAFVAGRGRRRVAFGMVVGVKTEEGYVYGYRRKREVTRQLLQVREDGRTDGVQMTCRADDQRLRLLTP